MRFQLIHLVSGALVVLCAGVPTSATVVTRTTPSAHTFGQVKQRNRR